MSDVDTLVSRLRERLSGVIQDLGVALGEATIVLNKADSHQALITLRDEPAFEFSQLIDVTVVDYLHYGDAQWSTTAASAEGFDRGVEKIHERQMGEDEDRYAVVYHLLSVSNNQRLRVKVYLKENDFKIASVNDIWAAANWFEREAFDLFGVVFENHPDMRRILTDYGFVGHPFRKDFPQSGYVEVQYDAAQGKVVYQPVDLEARVLVPKVIREDNRSNTSEKEVDNV